MSNPGVQPAVPDSTLIEQDGAIPETVQIPEEKPEAPDETKGAEAAVPEEKPAEQPKPKIKPWYQKRIDELSALRARERAEKDELAAKLAALEKPEGEETKFDPKTFEAIIDQRAEAKLAAKDYERRARSWVQAGQKEFGADFDNMCAEVAAMGVGDSPEFMQIITDPEIVPEGHKVIAMLRDNPDEAERILGMSPVKMSAALALMSTKDKPAAPEPVSKAPKPITPVGGSARPATLSDDQDMKTWLANRNKTARTTAGGKPNTQH